MVNEYSPDVVAGIKRRVAESLDRWALSRATAITLLNLSENATFVLSDPQGRELVLRVHRAGYSSLEEIRSELAWIDALRRDAGIQTAPPVPGVDGELVQVLESRAAASTADALRVNASRADSLCAHVSRPDEVPRFAVAFERLPGREPDSRDAVRWFGRLGELTARMHVHAKSWRPPPGFRRRRWDFESMVGPSGIWGSWRAAIGLDGTGVSILEQALDFIRHRLDRFGESTDVFHLVHADLRLANLLVDGADLHIIDFDDCGYSWFLYDFAAAVSFIEHEPVVAQLLHAWCEGYRRNSPLTPEHQAEIPTFVVLRRILLTAWLASHAEVPFAREFGASYTAGTVMLAQALMRGEFLNAGVR